MKTFKENGDLSETTKIAFAFILTDLSYFYLKPYGGATSACSFPELHGFPLTYYSKFSCINSGMTSNTNYINYFLDMIFWYLFVSIVWLVIYKLKRKVKNEKGS